MIITIHESASDRADREQREIRLRLKLREEQRQRKACLLQRGSGKSWHRSNRFRQIINHKS